MKLQRHLVALALLVGALGSKRHRHHRHTAVLLGERQARATVSLDNTTDKLQGVLDAVTVSINQVLGGYTKVRDACAAEVAASGQRVQAQTSYITDLETTRQINLERTAGLEATLANLVTQEQEAHTSYESSVTQRATALQKHLSTNKASVDQAKTIGDVLTKMKLKRDQITASQTSTANMTAPPPVAPTSSGSALDYIIGVLTNIQDTTTAKAEDGSTKHNENDADLERLVTSYKTTLQHIDKQYQTENARRMQAKVTARDAGEEKSLRDMLVDGENKLDKEYLALCGTDGKGGAVYAAIEAANFFLSQFKQQSANAINIMDALPDLSTATFLSVKQQGKLRGAQPVPSSGIEAAAQKLSASGESAQESAARWVIAQAAKLKDHASQRLVKAVSAKFPHGVPAHKVHPVRTVAPSQQLHMLIGAKTDNTAKASNTSAQDAEILQCVKDKQDLTDQIIAARIAARSARTDKMSAEARTAAVKNYRVIIEKQKGILSAAGSSTTSNWKPLQDLIASKNFTTDLADAVTEMSTIETEVQTYINAGGPPASAGLPTALKGIGQTLTNVKTRLEGDMNALESTYMKDAAGSFAIQYPALTNQLEVKDQDYSIEESAMADAVTISQDEVTKQEAAEKTLMSARAGVDYRCLQAGQCTNLHYQQCCSGSGSFMKKVNSWKECTDHCEAVVKEGNQIAGCSMADLYKKDDRSGSGTCYAQTACTLQPSTANCAGSLCKALTAK